MQTNTDDLDKPNTLKNLKKIKKVGVNLMVLLGALGLAVILGAALLNHRAQAVSFISNIEAIKPWLIVMRLALYLSIYSAWRFVLTRLKPDVSEVNIVEGRRLLVRLFIAYELLFGINIIALIVR
jgi:hypothetical protein